MLIKDRTDIQEETPSAYTEEIEAADAQALSTAMQPALTFSDSDTLVWPVVGNVLVNYSMDKTVYFPTLQQYKYNPAVILAAPQGSEVVACADGQVTKIYQNEEIGTAVVIDLGNGYEVTYGQLATYRMGLGDYVTAGQIIGTVAAPTKYYVTEGNNLYFSMKKNGVTINPEGLFLQ